MSPFKQYHQLTFDQNADAANARWRLRSHIRNVRRRYHQSLVMRAAFENLATGAYTPHQYRLCDYAPETCSFDDEYNPDHWMMPDIGQPHRVVFTFSPLPPPAE